jgi:DNA topoisomerase-1
VKWTDVLRRFYGSFEKDLGKATDGMKGEVLTDIDCEKCGRPMAIKSGRNGIFLACTGYPECRNTANFTRDEKGKIVVDAAPDTGEEKGTCEKCGKPMVTKNGRYGPFVACSGYPDCKNIWAPEPVSTHVPMSRGRLFRDPGGKNLKEREEVFCLQSISRVPVCHLG